MAKFDPDNPDDLKRLRDSISESRTVMQRYVQHRNRTIDRYVGSHYGEHKPNNRHEDALTFLKLAANIYVPQLAGHSPAAYVTGREERDRVLAKKIELNLNHRIRELKVDRILREAVYQALFFMGIVIVGPKRGADGEAELFIKSISPDDWFQDPDAPFDAASYMGYRYWIPYEEAVETRRYRKEALQSLTEDRDEDMLFVSGERADEIGHHRSSLDHPFVKKVYCYNAWIPESRLMITLPCGTEGYLEAWDWDGPAHGPFHQLGYGDVPDNAMPLAPMNDLYDLHVIGNMLFQKLSVQAAHEKTVFPYTPAGQSDAERIRDAGDLSMLKVDGQYPVQPLKIGGMNPNLMLMLTQVRDLFSWTGGNLDLLGGLGAASETYSQDALLSSTANKRIAEMQQRTIEFTRAILKDLAWYDLTDPNLDRRLYAETPLGRYGYDFKAEDVDERALEYDIDIIPYSMQLRTPNDRLKFLLEYVERIALRAPEQLQREGMQFSFKRFNSLVSQMSGMPELEELFIRLNQTPIPGVEPPEQVGRSAGPATTHHVTERVGRPGPSRAGRDHDMAMTIAGLSKGMAKSQQVA